MIAAEGPAGSMASTDALLAMASDPPQQANGRNRANKGAQQLRSGLNWTEQGFSQPPNAAGERLAASSSASQHHARGANRITGRFSPVRRLLLERAMSDSVVCVRVPLAWHQDPNHPVGEKVAGSISERSCAEYGCESAGSRVRPEQSQNDLPKQDVPLLQPQGATL